MNRVDRLPTSMMQWRDDPVILTYRCGGSAGVAV